MGTEQDLYGDFGAFYRSELDVVLAFCFRRTRDPELAADLAAEVFAAALIGRGRYRSSRGTPRQWLLGIAAHKVIEAQRRGQVERRAQQRLGMAQIAWTDGDLGLVVRLTNGDSVREFLDQLPEEQRSAVRARVIEEQSYRDIARASGVSQEAVRKRVSRGLSAVRRRLMKESR